MPTSKPSKAEQQSKPKKPHHSKEEEDKEAQLKLDEELAAALMYEDGGSGIPHAEHNGILDDIEQTDVPPAPEYKTEQLIPDRPHHYVPPPISKAEKKGRKSPPPDPKLLKEKEYERSD